jgi:site-specific recombinase XerD
MEAVKGHLARGVKPVSVNSWLTGVRAYGIWLWKEGHLKEKPRIELLKCEKKILATFGEQHIKALINWKPVGSNQARAHTMGLVALDSGLRVSEMLSLPRQNVDFDNLVLRVQGKGNKQRLVPMSVELRKSLCRYLGKHNHALVFATRTGTALTVRNSERDFKVMCQKAGIEGVRCSWHTLRHTFAVNYLRAGGNLYYLQRILGHSSISTTERYLRSLGIDDLKKVHDGLSLLSR